MVPLVERQGSERYSRECTTRKDVFTMMFGTSESLAQHHRHDVLYVQYRRELVFVK